MGGETLIKDWSACSYDLVAVALTAAAAAAAVNAGVVAEDEAGLLQDIIPDVLCYGVQQGSTVEPALAVAISPACLYF